MNEPKPHVVILGASNAARSLSSLIATARNVLEAESGLEVLAAVGRGRSYGAWTTVFGRRLCGIAQSGLWNALDVKRSTGAPSPCALITDVGNDIMYGFPPATIGEWVEACIEHLRRHEARIVMTSMPMHRARHVRPALYRALRALLFPRCTLSLEEALSRGEEVMQVLERLAQQHSIPLVHQPAEWYGLDPIHVKIRCLPIAWRTILSHWRPEQSSNGIALAGAAPLRWLRLTRAVPEEFPIFTLNFGRHQPAVTLPDGSRIWCY